MKAINFLEWCNENFIKDGHCMNEVPIKQAQFYSQPFTPSLITELFEGWEKKQIQRLAGDEFDIFYYVRISDHVIISYSDVHLRMEKFRINWKRERSVLLDMCPTLDNFISDMKRAGIELTWNKQTAEKF